MKNKTQISDIKKYLENHKKGITSLEAIDKFGATRLSSIIYVLRHKHGMNIQAEDKKVKTRYGRTAVVANYRLV